jgi:uncharacterized membrane protein
MSTDDDEPREEQEFDYSRTVSLSDCVFSIALTLLVLNLSVPLLSHTDTDELGGRLLAEHQQFEAYAISFAVIALFWVRHHATFRGLTRIDSTVTVLNLVYLGFIAFLPFPTRVLATYTNEPASIALYAATGAMISGIASLVRVHALRAHLLSPYGLRVMARREHAAFAPLIFLASIPLAFVLPRLAAYSWLLLLVVPGSQRWRARRT